MRTSKLFLTAGLAALAAFATLDTTGALPTVTVTATAESGDVSTFDARIRIDTPKERDYYEHGGILHYVLRQLAA